MEPHFVESVRTELPVPDGKVRLFSEEDYGELKQWWAGHKVRPVPLDRLPRGSGFGLMVPGLAAVFLYETGHAIGFIGNMVSNPDASKREVNAALDRLVYDLLWLAKERGIEIVQGDTTSVPVARRARKHGFHVKRGWCLSIEREYVKRGQ